MKRLAKAGDLKIECKGPFSDVEMIERDTEYDQMTSELFIKKYRRHLFTPATITINGHQHDIQVNYCYNPFCKWYGLSQKKYISTKSMPSRYKLSGSSLADETNLVCNNVDDPSIDGMVIIGEGTPISNWSLTEEIARLIQINSVVPFEGKYAFHRDDCEDFDSNPFSDCKKFHKRGKSTAGSAKYKCKVCGKMTNVLPSIEGNYNYHQQENAILLDLAKDIFSRTPVRRTCEKLSIGAGTYYLKLEILYRRCLEFLERRETKALKEASFEEIYLSTDTLNYSLNNIRAKGMAKGKGYDDIDKKLVTYLVASADSKSGYVFRADIAFDPAFKFEKLKEETEKYHCDHSYKFLRKNARYRDHPYYPQPPTDFDHQTYESYLREKQKVWHREVYVKGCHVQQTYTELAHYWLIKQSVKTKKWYFISDNDATIISSVCRTFVDEIKSKKSHYFTCQCNKKLTLEAAGKEYYLTRNKLNDWARYNGYEKLNTTAKARLWYEEFLERYDLYDYINVDGVDYPIPKSTTFDSPLSTKDEGTREINCLSDTRDLTNKELADILVNIGSWSTNNFFQELHRRVSVLERPLVTARGEGKSYIYANYNPEYAQQLVTIFRTLYNFCWTKEKGNSKVRKTPAQRLGIADKAYDLKDIIYFK